MFVKKTVGEVIESIRIFRGITPEDMTKRINVNVRLLENWDGKISEATLERIAKELGVRRVYIYILAEEGDDPMLKKLQSIIIDSIIEETLNDVIKT